MKKLFVMLFVVLFLFGSIAVAGDFRKIYSEKSEAEKVMALENPELEFSRRTKIYNDIAYMHMSLYSAEEYWGDFKLLRLKGIKTLHVYLNSPGGSVSTGYAITDELRLLRESDVEIIIEGRGCIASAAVPVFLQGTERLCTKNTIFLIHPSALVKWGLFFETLKDIESQAIMMKINRKNYADIVSSRTKLSQKEVMRMLEQDTWFTAQKALEWGFVTGIQ